MAREYGGIIPVGFVTGEIANLLKVKTVVKKQEELGNSSCFFSEVFTVSAENSTFLLLAKYSL